MSEIIKIKYQVDTNEVRKAEADLEKLVGAENALQKEARETSNAIDKTAVSYEKAALATKNMKRALEVSINPEQYKPLITSLDKLNVKIKAISKIKIDGDVEAKKSADAITKSIDGIKKASENASGSLKGELFKGLTQIGSIAAGAFAFDKVVEFGKAVIETTASFQKFEAVLTNTLGSNSAAKQALKEIQDFAAKTPFSVEELTESFVKLANFGFVPTQNQMRQLGDIASSTGKDFGQLTDAFTDAQTGNFEKLEEFYIKSEKDGDKVKFNFKGVTTEVQNTSNAITKYLLGLGDLKGVTGGMAAVSGTLGGQISNLGDSFDQVKLKIGKDLSPILSVLIGYLSNMGSIWDFVREKVNDVFAPIGRLVKAVTDLVGTFGMTGGSVDVLGSAMSALGAVVDQMTFFFRAGVETAVLFSQILGTVLNSAKELSNFLLNTTFELNADLDIAKVGEKVSAYKERALNGFKDVNKDIKKEVIGSGNELDEIRKKQNAKAAGISDEAKKKQIETEKEANKKLRELRQQNAITAAGDDLEKARLKIKFDYENSKLEVAGSSKKNEILKELENKRLLETEAVNRASRDKQNDENLTAALTGLETIAQREAENIELLAAQGIVTQQQADSAKIASQLSSLETQKEYYDIYLSSIDTSTTAGVEKYRATQQQITDLSKQQTDIRVAQNIDNARKEAAAYETLLELRVKYSTGESKVTAIKEQTELQAKQEPDRVKKADIRVSGEGEVLETRMSELKRVFDLEGSLESASFERSRKYYEDRKRLLTESYDLRIKLLQAEGIDTSLLEQQKNAALKENSKMQFSEEQQIFASKVNTVQQYAAQVSTIANEVSSVYYQAQLQELNDLQAANQVKISIKDAEINNIKGRVEKANGIQKKELQAQLKLEENNKKQLLATEAELEEKKEAKRKEQNAIKKATSISEAIINTAVAVTKTYAEFGGVAGLPLAVLTGLAGAAQVATIAAQPLAEGTLSVKGGIEGRDSVLTLLMPGEAVIPTKKSRIYAPALKMIHEGTIAPELINNIGEFSMLKAQPLVYKNSITNDINIFRTLANDYSRLEKQLNSINYKLNALENLNINQLQINLDSDGINQYVTRGNDRQRVLGKI